MRRREFLRLLGAGSLMLSSVHSFGSTARRKRIFITIDDSPKEETTRDILKLLESFGIQATFFCIGWRLNKFRDIALEVLGAGHTLGNHSYSHTGFSNLSFDRRVREITYTDRLLRGLNSELKTTHRRIWRFPYGDYGKDIRIFRVLRRLRYKVIGWNIDTQDWRYYSKSSRLSVKEILRRSRSKERDIVILLHDIPITAHRILPYLIEYYMEKGYSFEKL
jgi:peptidoglycan/xylan/chitin deacetylase (PgdA/CDA1 family)